MGLVTRTHKGLYATYKSGLLFSTAKSQFTKPFKHGSDIIGTLFFLAATPVVLSLALVASILSTLDYLAYATVKYKSNPQLASESFSEAGYLAIDSLVLPVLIAIAPLYWALALIAQAIVTTLPKATQERMHNQQEESDGTRLMGLIFNRG